MARKMVCEWGMSEKLGPLAFGKKEEQIFLGREINRSQDYSADTAIQIDAEVRAIVMEQYEQAKGLLTEHREVLDRISQALLEYETLDGDDIQVLVSGGEIKRQKPVPPAAASGEPKEKNKAAG